MSLTKFNPTPCTSKISLIDEVNNESPLIVGKVRGMAAARGLGVQRIFFVLTRDFRLDIVFTHIYTIRMKQLKTFHIEVDNLERMKRNCEKFGFTQTSFINFLISGYSIQALMDMADARKNLPEEAEEWGIKSTRKGKSMK